MALYKLAPYSILGIRTDGRSGPTTRPAFAKATQVKNTIINSILVRAIIWYFRNYSMCVQTVLLQSNISGIYCTLPIHFGSPCFLHVLSFWHTNALLTSDGISYPSSQLKEQTLLKKLSFVHVGIALSIGESCGHVIAEKEYYKCIN